jgi:hypothetical protein
MCDALQILHFCNPSRHDFKHKHLWVKKATGLGVTELFLRFMAWVCLKDDTYKNSQMCIVTGPNQDIAMKLMKRMKGLFGPHNITFANKETVLELNGCTVEAFPSNHFMSLIVVFIISFNSGLSYSSACSICIWLSTHSVITTPKAEDPNPGSSPIDFCM